MMKIEPEKIVIELPVNKEKVDSREEYTCLRDALNIALDTMLASEIDLSVEACCVLRLLRSMELEARQIKKD